MKLGFVVSHYEQEKRVPLLPKHIKDFENELVIEEGLGATVGIADEEYAKAGCEVLSREEVFATCEAIVCLKVLQPEDYPLIREGQMIIGWIHPEVSGKPFWDEQGKKKNLIGVNLDNIEPRIFFQDEWIDIPWIPRDFVYKNSFNAGTAATVHALMAHGLILNDQYKVAILGSGNVAQGAMHVVSKYSENVRMYYRKTLPEFIENIETFDIVINGIAVGVGDPPIVTVEAQEKMKENVFIIDAAADADGAIEGTDYTSFDEPIVKSGGRYYYCIANVPTIYYRTASEDSANPLANGYIKTM